MSYEKIHNCLTIIKEVSLSKFIVIALILLCILGFSFKDEVKSMINKNDNSITVKEIEPEVDAFAAAYVYALNEGNINPIAKYINPNSDYYTELKRYLASKEHENKTYTKYEINIIDYHPSTQRLETAECYLHYKDTNGTPKEVPLGKKNYKIHKDENGNFKFEL